MKQTKKLISFLLAAVMILSMLPVMVFAEDTKGSTTPTGGNSQQIPTPDGLELHKTATLNDDGTVTIRLETYTTGNITTEEHALPMDIVLVLDQSSSMKDPFVSGGTGSKQAALKTAVSNFIETIADKYSTETDHRIAIVTFGDDAAIKNGWTLVDDTGKGTLTDTISTLPDRPGGATNTLAGMSNAENLLDSQFQYTYTGSNTTRQKVVVLFTDGVPTSNITGSAFDGNTANGTLASANRLKNNDVMLYSVGIQDSADVNEYDLELNTTINLGGPSAGASEGSLALGNRFLNYVSSNFVGISDMGGDFWFVGDEFFISIGIMDPSAKFYFKPTANNPCTHEGYYLTADNAEALNNVFQSIIVQIAVPTISLSQETIIRDTVTNEFSIPEGAEVRLYTAACNGKNADGFTFGSDIEFTEGSIEVNGDTVSITGYDYDANVCLEITGDTGNTYQGKKLIIEFDIIPKDNTTLETDLTDTNMSVSGVYIPNEDGEPTPLAYYEIPNVPATKVVVKYVDEDGIELTADDVCYVLPSVSFTARAKDIDDYALLPDQDADKTKTIGTEQETITFVYGGVFYVRHSSDMDATPDKIPLRALNGGTFDITKPIDGAYAGIRPHYLYGGLAEDAAFAKPITDMNGKSLQPERGNTYFLREVNEAYLQPAVISVRRKPWDDTVEHFLLTVLDKDGVGKDFYLRYGFAYNTTVTDPTANVTTISNIGVVDSQIGYVQTGDPEEFDDNMNCLLYKRIELYNWGKHEATWRPNDVFFPIPVFISASQLAEIPHPVVPVVEEDDYFGCTPVDTNYVTNGQFTFVPYYVTADGVLVTGITVRTTDYSGQVTQTWTQSADTAVASHTCMAPDLQQPAKSQMRIVNAMSTLSVEEESPITTQLLLAKPANMKPTTSKFAARRFVMVRGIAPADCAITNTPCRLSVLVYLR